jgi:hypothetical protein
MIPKTENRYYQLFTGIIFYILDYYKKKLIETS